MRILVVEDEKKIANAVAQGLRQQSYAVDVAYEGGEGLNLGLNEPYDLIILDLMLPGVNGMEILKQLRDAKKSTPVLLLTAKDKVLDRAYGLNAGADDYLVKPFAFVELIARVRALLRRPTKSTGAILNYLDLSLDPIGKTVTRQGQDIELTAKEFGLLEYLMNNPERIISKDSLIKHVWNYDADILPNTVEVYIGYLRNKLEKPFKGPKLINTRRGFGYYFGRLSHVS